jgi:hypothetical protein
MSSTAGRGWITLRRCGFASRWYTRLGDVPGDSGNIAGRIPIDPEITDPRATEPGVVDVAVICHQPPELRGTFRKLRQAIPYRIGTLGEALYAAMTAAFRQARDLLPTDAREAMAAEKNVSVRDLPEPIRDLLQQAVHLHWGSEVLAAIESPPSWLTQLEAGTLEWGLYSYAISETDTREYVVISGPDGWDPMFMTGISEARDG